MLDIWNEKISELAQKIYIERSKIIDKIGDRIKEIHNEITDSKEKIEIKYISNCSNKEEYLEKLKIYEKIDIQRGFTSIGIHRDDFDILINGKSVNVYGSQGQQRTSVLSLKLAEVEVIHDEIMEYPILLLDDFMSELDEKRRNKFISTIKSNQVFITCTDKLETKNGKIFQVIDGKVG